MEGENKEILDAYNSMYYNGGMSDSYVNADPRYFVLNQDEYKKINSDYCSIDDEHISNKTTYSSEKIEEIVNSISSFDVVVVDELPETGNAHTIYFVPVSSGATDNCDEYIWIDGKWELIGTTRIDLSNYYTKGEINELLTAKQDLISDLESIRSGAALGATALQSFTETDPTVPAWAKAADKPSYTASEVGAAATVHTHEISDVSGLTEALSAISVDLLQEVTYTQLKSLRDSSQLVPGQQYRITDFVTTTTLGNTQSAGHQFDIIVTADNVNKLNENARAIQHSGDTYFADCVLAAWKLKYCLDNDTNRFMWADASNGKGVIYHMEDEWGNKDWYDFKNMQFPRYKITECQSIPDFENLYGMDGNDKYTVDTGTTYWCYKHSVIDLNDDNVYDVTVFQDRYQSDEGYAYHNYGNTSEQFFETLWDDETGEAKQLLSLPNTVFVTDTDIIAADSYDSETGKYGYSEFYGYYMNSFGEYCINNTFGNEVYNNTIGNGFGSNTIGNEVYNNTIGNNVYRNTIGNYFYQNSIGNSFFWNTIGNDFYQNSIGNYFQNNNIGNNFNWNTIGNNFGGNTIGNGFQYNTIGNEVYNNTIGNEFNNNTIGNEVYNNTIGNYFNWNTIGNNVYRNTIGNDYIRNCSFGDGVLYCSITGYTTSDSDCLQYIIVLNGTQGSSGNLLELSGLSTNVSYSQTCGLNSSGTYTHKNLLD